MRSNPLLSLAMAAGLVVAACNPAFAVATEVAGQVEDFCTTSLDFQHIDFSPRQEEVARFPGALAGGSDKDQAILFRAGEVLTIGLFSARGCLDIDSLRLVAFWSPSDAQDRACRLDRRVAV